MKRLLLPLLFIAGSASAQVEFDFDKAQKLRGPINSEFEETAPFWDENESALYFTRSLHPDNNGGKTGGQDIWVSYKRGNDWTEPTNDFPKLNNQLNNSVVGISADGNELFLQSTYQKKIELQPGFASSIRDGESWQKPKKLPSTGLTIQGDFYSGWVNSDGNILLISMEGRESKGQEDLYVSILENGNWSNPIWLGDSVNSQGYEISPYLYDDNRTLIFGSNGHPGLGDCDLFYTYRKDSTWNNWTTPENMGAPINSAKFDAFANPVNELMYFASNRDDTLSNIYTAVNNLFFKEAAPLEFVFRMNETNMPNAIVDVYDENGELIGEYVAQGDKVKIEGLRQKTQYKIVPRHGNLNPAIFSPYRLNSEGDPIEKLEFDDTGALTYVPKSAEETASAEPVEFTPFERGMSGVFELDGVPVRNVIMALNDESGKAVQYAATDAEGQFAFSEMKDEQNMTMSIESELEYIKENGVVFYTDAQGRKLFRAAKGEEGSFAYQRLQAQELAQLKLLSELEDKELSQTEGVFKYQNLAQEGVTLYLLDENDNIVETVVTDADGKFKFNKLDPDQNFKIRVSDEEDSELNTDGMVYFLDKDGNELNILNNNQEDGGFSYKPLSADLYQGMQLLAEEDNAAGLSHFLFSVGLFKYKNLPKAGTKLQLLDENDNVIEIVTTDEDGHFVFSKLTPDMKYKVRVMDMEDPELKESVIYFVNRNGQVTTANLDDVRGYYTFRKLSPDYFFSVRQINEAENDVLITESFKDVTGTFKYKNLAKAGVELYLLDENDNVIERVYTDENGNFKFQKLAKEANFSVRMSEEDMALLQDADILLQNEDAEYLEQEMSEDGEFKFKTLPRTGGALAIEEEQDQGLNTSKFLSAQNEMEEAEIQDSEVGLPSSILGASGKNDLTLNTTVFHFNSVRLSDRDRAKLNKEVLIPTLRSNQPIVVIGYSCDIGSREQQEEVAKRRAKEIKSYLISAGLPESQVEMTTVTGMLDDVENPTTDQRVENRKVEVLHLIP